jgi:hypothetical protein
MQCLLTSVLDGSMQPDSYPEYFIQKKRGSGTHRIGGWLDPAASLVKRKTDHFRNQNMVIQPTADVYTD